MRAIRVGTIIWGCVLLVLAAATFSVAVFDLREFQAQAVIFVVTGIGGVLVLTAIIALIVRALSGGEPEVAPVIAERVSTGSTTETVSTTQTGSSAGKTTKKGQPVD